jgi:uncharacterized protein YgbK (DUF1537 family)
LAQVVVCLAQEARIATILAEGGATAAALAEAMGWRRFRVVQSPPAGVGVLEPIDAKRATTFLIKPGSYSWPEEIWEQLR